MVEGFDAQSENWAVGDTVYLGTGTDLEVAPDGYYCVIRPNTAPENIGGNIAHHIVSGIITEILISWY